MILNSVPGLSSSVNRIISLIRFDLQDKFCYTCRMKDREEPDLSMERLYSQREHHLLVNLRRQHLQAKKERV